MTVTKPYLINRISFLLSLSIQQIGKLHIILKPEAQAEIDLINKLHNDMKVVSIGHTETRRDAGNEELERFLKLYSATCQAHLEMMELQLVRIPINTKAEHWSVQNCAEQTLKELTDTYYKLCKSLEEEINDRQENPV